MHNVGTLVSRVKVNSWDVYLGCGSFCDNKSCISRTLINLGFRDDDLSIIKGPSVNASSSFFVVQESEGGGG